MREWLTERITKKRNPNIGCKEASTNETTQIKSNLQNLKVNHCTHECQWYCVGATFVVVCIVFKFVIVIKWNWKELGIYSEGVKISQEV